MLIESLEASAYLKNTNEDGSKNICGISTPIVCKYMLKIVFLHILGTCEVGNIPL